MFQEYVIMFRTTKNNKFQVETGGWNHKIECVNFVLKDLSEMNFITF